jgi:hypothetical protein
MSKRERMLGVLYATPRSPEIDQRKRRFDDINAFISQRGGWCTSVPGSHEITFDALVGSPLPDQLRGLGYSVEKTGESQRILPHAIRQKFTVRADGELEPFTEGSSKPVTLTVTNAAIAIVEQYELHLRHP